MLRYNENINIKHIKKEKIIVENKLDLIVNNIKEIRDVKAENIESEIIESFNGYEFEGESYVILSSPTEMNCFRLSEGEHYAYINHKDAPIVSFELEESGEDSFSVVDAWWN
jgi:hypothetical protein